MNSIRTNSNEPQGIDFEKLRLIFRKNLLWIILILIVTNTAAYLTIRWTKEVFESTSELKIEIRQDALELGMNRPVLEDQNLNIISGEIEQIRSKTFFNRLTDSLDINVGYFSMGKVLNYEMYKSSPFHVDYSLKGIPLFDAPFYFNFIDDATYSLQIGQRENIISGTFGTPLEAGGFEIVITQSSPDVTPDNNNYFFVIHSREALLDYLVNNITVEPLNFNANTIKVSFSDFNAWKTQDIVNKIDSVYIMYSNEQKNLANKQKIDWLSNELQQIEIKMEGFENYFENFTLQNKSSSVNEDLSRTIVLINEVDSQRFELNKRINDLNQLIENISSTGEVVIIPYQKIPTFISSKLEELQVLLQEQRRLGLTYNENTFAFRQKEQQLNSLRDQVFNQLADLKTSWLENMSELNQKKENLENEFASMPDKNTQFSKNQRFYNLYTDFYLSMMQARAETEIAQAGSTPDFKILSSATFPSTPKSPQKLMIVGIGIVGGLVFNFFFIGLLYLTHNKITSVSEIEQSIDLPVLGSIPISSTSSSSPLQVTDNPKSMVSESIRALRTNLDFFTTGHGKKVIAISSTISGEGKSFLATNLCGVLALSQKRVILLDLDMRKTKEFETFGHIPNGHGISTTLIKKSTWQECLVKTALPNFDYFPAGPHPPNPSELLMNGEFSNLLEDLKNEYDFIVMDTPPVGLVTDGIMAMKKADLSIYVIRANYSKKDFLFNLQRLVKLNKLSHTAIVLNALHTPSNSYGYGYYSEEKAETSWRRKIFGS